MDKLSKKGPLKRWLCLGMCAMLLPLSGCFDMREPDDLAYVIAVGVDEAEGGGYLYTFQYANPLKFASGDGGGDGGGEEGKPPESIASITVKAPTLFAALGDTENYLSKQTTFMHMRLIVYSKQMAEKGIGDEFMEFVRNADLHPNTIVAVSATQAREYLASVAPPLEANPLKHYDMLFNKTFQPFSPSTTIREFYYDSAVPDRHAIAAYVGVGEHREVGELSLLSQDSDVLGDGKEQEPQGHNQVSDFKTEIIGMAIFRNAKVVGKAGGIDTKIYQMLTGNFDSAIFTINAPDAEGQKVTARVESKEDPDYDLKIENGVPKIKVHLTLTGEYLTMPDSHITYGKDNLYNQVFGQLISERAQTFATLTAREYQSDIFGFGKKFRRFFSTWKEWETFDWDERYPVTEFEVSADVAMEISGTIMRNGEKEGDAK